VINLDIKELQKFLNFHTGNRLEIDGKIGPNTRKVFDYFKKYKLYCPLSTDAEAIKKIERYESIDEDMTYWYNEISKCIPEGLDALVLMSQFALETNFFKNITGNFNLGNIKGSGEIITTTENINGKNVKLKDSFKKYTFLKDFITDYVRLITLDRYYKAFVNSKNPYMYYKGLKDGGYATDPQYVQKCCDVYEFLWIWKISWYLK
jgi:hypothetical protein